MECLWTKKNRSHVWSPARLLHFLWCYGPLLQYSPKLLRIFVGIVSRLNLITSQIYPVTLELWPFNHQNFTLAIFCLTILWKLGCFVDMSLCLGTQTSALFCDMSLCLGTQTSIVELEVLELSIFVHRER
jgi:hypothetical protein